MLAQVRNTYNGDTCRPDFQRIRINTKMDLAPLAQLERRVFPAEPVGFARSLDRSAIGATRCWRPALIARTRPDATGFSPTLSFAARAARTMPSTGGAVGPGYWLLMH